jgi:hypothetical protein
LGFVGDLTITDEFNGTLCAVGFCNLDDVNFGANGKLCTNPPACTSCQTCSALSDPAEPELTAVAKNRFIAMGLPSDSTDYAIRVTLDSLHHPDSPSNAPNMSAYEGQFRWVNSIAPSTTPPHNCVDSATHGTSFRCAKLGCCPEYRDWDTELTVASVIQDLHVMGREVVPSSEYIIQLRYAAGAPTDPCYSCGIRVETGKWGDVYEPGIHANPNATDIAKIVDKAKDLSTAIPEQRALLRGNTNMGGIPDPLGVVVNAQDIALVVDAVKGDPYPYSGPTACSPCP